MLRRREHPHSVHQPRDRQAEKRVQILRRGRLPKTRHAQHLLLTERRAEAMPLLLAAHAAAPWSFDVVQSLGLAYMARGDLVRARLHLRKALGWAIDYPALRAELATLLDGIEALEARQRRLPLGGDIDESTAVQ